MVTLLDCIKRIPTVLENILNQQDDAFFPLLSYLDTKIHSIDEIVLIGSGTSNTASVTSRSLIEKVSGIRVKTVLPGEYDDDFCVCNPNALHVFTSQTGTSTVVCRVMEKLAAGNFLCVSITDSPASQLALLSPCHVCMNCGEEEYLMRTIGYTSSVLNHILLGLRIGLARSFLTPMQYDAYQKELRKIPDSHRAVTNQALTWFPKNKRLLMRSNAIIFTGAGSLYGVSLEAAVKFWEMPQVTAMGYELEEGMHGPNYGYSYEHCVIVLNNGDKNSAKALSLARYMKDVFHHGLVIGSEVADDLDLKLDLQSANFTCLEISAVPQVMAYCLAEDGGRDLRIRDPHTVMYSYFHTHQTSPDVSPSSKAGEA